MRWTSLRKRPTGCSKAIKASGDPQVVLTPHEGEFPRLFSDISDKHPSARKLERVRAAAERSRRGGAAEGIGQRGAVSDGRATIAANAPPWLATAAPATCWRNDRGSAGRKVSALRGASNRRLDARRGRARGGPRPDRGRSAGSLPAVFRRLYDEFASIISIVIRSVSALAETSLGDDLKLARSSFHELHDEDGRGDQVRRHREEHLRRRVRRSSTSARRKRSILSAEAMDCFAEPCHRARIRATRGSHDVEGYGALPQRSDFVEVFCLQGRGRSPRQMHTPGPASASHRRKMQGVR